LTIIRVAINLSLTRYIYRHSDKMNSTAIIDNA
jgi:hypothetical protein